MKNDKGFTLIETLVAMGVVMMLVATIIPINILLKQERKTLLDRRLIASSLHDALQEAIWENDLVWNNARTINNKLVTFEFNKDSDFIKGCAIWENSKQDSETICLYGYKKE